MHSKEEVCLYLLAREDGMRRSEAAAFAGVSASAARHWDEGRLPRSYTGAPWGSGRIPGDGASGRKAARMATKGLYDPPAGGRCPA